MKISFYNGVSGIMAMQEDMNRIAHNVANSGTVGYKPDKSTFSDLLYTRMAVNAPTEPLTGHGVKINDARTIFRQGAAPSTGCELDFALMGDGFFAVRRPDGEIQYTRNGAFNISIEGDKGFLVTEDGSYVLDSAGKEIELTLQENSGLFDLKGLQEKLGIYDFPNPHGLQHETYSCFSQTELSGEPVAIIQGETTYEGRHYQILSSALEQSAVDLADEMVGVITAQRAYQLNARMVQTADELEQLVNNLR